MIENVRDITVFQCVREAGSFTEAARLLGVTQPAVSLAIRRLEKQLETTLFERHRFGAGEVALTESGNILATHAPALLEHLATIVQEIEDVEGQRPIRLGLPPIIMRHYLKNRMSELTGAFRGRRITVCSFGSERTLRELRHHSLDLGAVASTARSLRIPHVRCVRVATFPFCLVVPRDHPLAAYDSIDLERFKTLPSYPFVSFTSDFVQHDVFARLTKQCRREFGVAAETSQLPVFKDLVASGVGIGFVASLSIDEAQDGLVLIPIKGAGTPSFNVFVFEDVSRPVRPDSDCIKQALDVLCDACAAGRAGRGVFGEPSHTKESRSSAGLATPPTSITNVPIWPEKTR